jgi:DNA-binding transcriptional MerR regulator
VAIDIKENSLPCAIYGEGENIYKLAIEGNLDEDTYAPMDLFDWLDIIKKLKNEGLTQKEIGVKIGWSSEKVMQYSALLGNILTRILDLCRQYQKGRVSEKLTGVSFDFTEGWFRTSGLYDLKPVIYQIIEEEKPVNYETNFQEKVIKNFIKDNCKWNKTKLQQETAKYKLWTEFIEISMDKLADLYNMEIIYNLIVNDTFKIKEVLLKKIEELNKQAENKLICGDALIELEKLEDATIDIVITDPPYGIDYISNRGKYSGNVASEGIENDKTEEAFPLLEKTCEVLNCF